VSLVSVLPQRLALPPPPRPPRRPHPSGPPWRGGGWWRRALRCPLTRLPPSGSHPSLPDRAPLWPTDPWRRTPALPSGCPPGRPASPPLFPGKSGHRNADRKHITQCFKLFLEHITIRMQLYQYDLHPPNNKIRMRPHNKFSSITQLNPQSLSSFSVSRRRPPAAPTRPTIIRPSEPSLLD